MRRGNVLPMRAAANLDRGLSNVDKVALALEHAEVLADLAGCVVRNGYADELNEHTLAAALASIEGYVRDAAAANLESCRQPTVSRSGMPS